MGLSGRDIVKRIKEKLPEGVSLKTMARSVGIPWQTVYGWDAQNSAPKGRDLLTVANFLKVPVYWLLTGAYEGGAGYGRNGFNRALQKTP
jgi:hypothetical protein